MSTSKIYMCRMKSVTSHVSWGMKSHGASASSWSALRPNNAHCTCEQWAEFEGSAPRDWGDRYHFSPLGVYVTWNVECSGMTFSFDFFLFFYVYLSLSADDVLMLTAQKPLYAGLSLRARHNIEPSLAYFLRVASLVHFEWSMV